MIPNNFISAAAFTPISLQYPNAWVGHLPFAAWVIQEVSPKIFVELGTHSGNSYFSFCQSVVEAGLSTKCYSVDTWQGDAHAGQYNEDIFAKVNTHHQEHYAGFSRLLRMTFDDAASYFADESIELLHIDGLHTYEAVRHDFETWLPKLAPGAVVMFHDTNVRERNFGVWKLWEELQARYPRNLEFVHSHGLGVLQLNNAPDGQKLDWLQPNSPEKQRLINYFASLGSRQLERFELKQQAASLNRAVTERDGQIASLNQAVTERDGQIASLNQAVTERDGQIASLNRAVTERDGQIASLNQAVTERDGQIASLNQAVTERDGQIASLNQAVTERDGQIASLNQTMTDRADQHEQAGIALTHSLRGARANEFSQHIEIEKLSRVRLEHLQQIDALNARLLATYQSRSWRLTRPLRAATRLLAWLQTPKPLRLARNGVLAVQGEVRRHGVLGFARRLPHFLRHARTYASLLTSPLPEAKAKLFEVATPTVRALRLHPDLTEVTDAIDASISIVIPTFNAGTEFKWLLRKLQTQRGLKDLEVVIVDSGSSDKTVLWARQAGCTVVEITQAEFTHSHARNLGAANARSDYVLFMVQDAYPVGDYWAYGMLRFLLDHADSGLVAASCSEYPRSDSDMMYDSMINIHYRFLGCHEQDRIGDFQGSDHMALRSRGQLSDVACLISREMFGQYGYQGDYAEDLDLGIRLIKDGHKVAMLASVKVVHSHNRAAFYYLKRSYVDVIFLFGMFKDLTFPPVESVPGLLAGIVSGARHVSDLLPALQEAAPGLLLSEVLANWIAACKLRCNTLTLDGTSAMGDARLDSYMDGLAKRLDPADLDSLARGQAQRFTDTFFARLEHFNTFAAEVYGAHDAGLREALQQVVRKTFAAAAGSALGFMYMDKLASPGADQAMVDAINQELRVGV
jgi:glycosyltransferase involved in cell wall biosynthesis/ACT domain-containing protein